MSKFFGYFKDYKVKAVLGPLFKFAEATFELLVPFIVQKVIDNGIDKGDMGYVRNGFLYLILFSVVGFLFAITAQYFSAKTACSVAGEIRKDLFKSTQRLSPDAFTELRPDRLSNVVIGDVNSIQSGINLTLRLLLRSPFIVFGAFIAAFCISKKISLIFLSVILVLAVAVYFSMKYSIPALKKARKKTDELSSDVDETSDGVKVIRGFNKEVKEEDKFNGLSNEAEKLSIAASNISVWLNPITLLVVNIGICLVIYFGGFNVYHGALTKGAVVSLYNLILQILTELLKFANMIHSVSKAKNGWNRCKDVFKFCDEHQDDRKYEKFSIKDTPVVEVSNLVFSYPDASKPSLNGISFKVTPGEKIGIIGKTGSGKSTLLKVLSKQNDIYDGSILIDGVELKSISPEDNASVTGFYSPKCKLFSQTIIDNIILSRSISEERAKQALDEACASELMQKQTSGEKINGNGKNISGGQRQRLLLARVFAGDPKVMYLDNPTSSLDAITAEKIINRLSDASLKSTVFIATQRVNLIKKCDRIFVMDDGKLVASGSHDELSLKSDLYREFVSEQEENL